MKYKPTPWVKLLALQVQGRCDERFAQVTNFDELINFRRNQRKNCFHTDTPVLEILNDGFLHPPADTVDWFCRTLAEYINAFLISKRIYGQINFCRSFAHFSVIQIAYGSIGDESFDDIIALGELLVNDRELFVLVAANNLPAVEYVDLLDWLTDQETTPPRFSECVFGGVCAMLGVIPLPKNDEFSNAEDEW